MNTIELTYIAATPGHWSVYRIGDAFIKRPVIAWGLAQDRSGTMAACIHPGVTAYADTPVAVIDPSGLVTIASGRTFASWRMFLAWVKAGGVIE